MDPWEVLGIAPTDDALTIRKAYAARSKEVHPEEDPEGFLRLRKAYERALAWVKRANERGALSPSRPVRPERPPSNGIREALKSRDTIAHFPNLKELEYPNEIQEALENMDESIPYVPPTEELVFEEMARAESANAKANAAAPMARVARGTWVFIVIMILLFSFRNSRPSSPSPPTAKFQVPTRQGQGPRSTSNRNSRPSSPSPPTAKFRTPTRQGQRPQPRSTSNKTNPAISDEEMFRLYRYFAVKGDSVAWHNLGLAYVLGRGVKTDYARAMYWFSSAAEAGHPDAQNDLAFMYEAGMGVPKDRDRAIKLYKTAARWGSKMARKNLERLGVFVSSDQSGIE